MLKYLLSSIGLALLGGGLLLGQTPARGSDACGAKGCCDGSCNACSQCDGSCKCCPQCGCRLVPVCHPYCENKTITKHEYCCHCKDHCVPGPERCCKDCDGCCQEECCHCAIREIHKLAFFPVAKEEPVRRCTVEWVCPKCSANASAAPVIVTPAPALPANPSVPHVAPPAAPPPPPPPTKTTNSAPLPGDLSTAENP